MSLKKYEAFVRTVELGSLTKAAEAMGASSFCAGTGAASG